jgi:type III pantothenate kinase
MSSHNCVVAVDVGNTAVKLALRMESSVEPREVRIGSSGWELGVIGWVRDKLGGRHAAGDSPQWRIASVQRAAAAQLQHAIRNAQSDAAIKMISWRDVPIAVHVDEPDRVGIDRVLSAYAAWIRFQSPLVVIDAGSAITVDWVDATGAFCGGAIMPGLELQARSLVMGTEALPQIELNQGAAIRLPATNTADAIRAGIVLGVASALDGMIDRYADNRQRSSDSFSVVLTGGDAPLLSPQLRKLHQTIPNLVCQGLLHLDPNSGDR